MNEGTLFAAYRHRAGYAAQCACGGWINASGDSESVAGAVYLHNLSTWHQQWSREQAAVKSMTRQPLRPCPCHDGAGRA